MWIYSFLLHSFRAGRWDAEKSYLQSPGSLTLGSPRQNMPFMLLLNTGCFHHFVNGLCTPKGLDKYTCLRLMRGFVGCSRAQRRQELKGDELDCSVMPFCLEHIYQYVEQSLLIGNKRLGPRFGQKAPAGA